MNKFEFEKAVEGAEGDVGKLEAIIHDYLQTDPAWKEVR